MYSYIHTYLISKPILSRAVQIANVAKAGALIKRLDGKARSSTKKFWRSCINGRHTNWHRHIGISCIFYNNNYCYFIHLPPVLTSCCSITRRISNSFRKAKQTTPSWDKFEGYPKLTKITTNTMTELKFIQVNLNKAKQGQIELNSRIRSWNKNREPFACIVQEPLVGENGMLLQPTNCQSFKKGLKPRAVIYTDSNQHAWILETLSNRDLCIVCLLYTSDAADE